VPGLTITTGNRMERLVEALAAHVREPLPDPLAPETIVVQSRGMQRWVSLELARLNGIAANCRFPFPKAFLQEVFAVYDPPEAPESGWDEEHLAFRILARLPGLAARDPAFAPVRRYLADDPHGLKAFQLAGRIARVFDQYLVFRPEMIRAWERGSREAAPAGDWQPRLWRILRQAFPEDHFVSRVTRLEACVQRGAPPARPLPPRVALFGVSYLPPLLLHILHQLARVIPVHLFLLNPCREFWGDILSRREALRLQGLAAPAASGESPEDLHLEQGHRLLASLGQVGRDFLGLVSAFEGQVVERFDAPAGGSLLEALQRDILNLQESSRGAVPAVSAADGSIQVHACHAPLREVEVLHDLLLDLFQKAPDIEPRHVLVMTPDIEAYAPYIHAVFGARPGTNPRIPYSVADRSLPRESLLVEAFLALLDLHNSRMESSRVLHLLDFPSIRERFGLSAADRETVGRWIRDSGIRWGLDAQHREAQGLPARSEHTWQSGTDRLLLGYLMAGDGERLFESDLPHPPIEGDEARVLGRWLRLADMLAEHYREIKKPKKPNDWNSYIEAMLDNFLAAGDDTARERRLLVHGSRSLESMARSAGLDALLGIEVVQAFFASRLEREGLGGGFITGGVTFCALLPMRAIPMPVIALLGMNDGVFPRDDRPPGFDLMARRPRPGDRSRRADDKYLFLEALLSARRRLIITHVGFDPRDHALRPPALPVCELLEALVQGYGADPDRLVTRHRLQGFAPDYFDPGAPRLFSYSETHLAAARSLARARREGAAEAIFFPTPLPAPESEEATVALEDLAAFCAHPARHLLTRRLDIDLRRAAAGETDREPFDLDPGIRYRMGQSLVDGALGGIPPETRLAVERASGRLPQDPAGSLRFRELAAEVRERLERVRPLWTSPPHPPLDLDLHLGKDRLAGRLVPLYAAGQLLVRHAAVKAQDLLGAWIRHLALCALHPAGVALETLLVNRDEVRRFGAVEGAEAHLRRLLELYREGSRRLLPIFPRASLAYARVVLEEGREPVQARERARREFDGGERRTGDREDPHVALAWRGTPDPLGEGFETLALELYAGVFECSTPISGALPEGGGPRARGGNP